MSPSPIRCRGPWKIHKRLSEPDRWLDEMGFFRKHTARDSSCLFRAVSENIYNTQRYYHKVRLECVQFMASSRHLFEGSLSCPFENYLKEMSNPSEYGGLIEISAMSHCYRRDFVIFEANKGPQIKICNGYGDTIYLFYSSDTKHFDAVYTKEFINASSFCQSLVYEILYDGVYQLKDLPHAVEKMLHDKIPTNHNEYFMLENVERRKKQKERAKIFIEPPREEDKDKNNNTLALKCKHHTEDLERASLLRESLSIFVLNRSLIQLENVCMNCLNVNSAKDLLENGITPFPYKVAKALDPDIYRNIEFDVWSELRREMRYGARYCDGTTLQVGVKCLCKLQSDQTVAYHCHIQEMRPDGPCLVFIEELGEKRVVNYEQLEPLPVDEIKPWAPPYRYSRANSQIVNISQMLQQIGNISRKQGLKTRNKSKGDDRKLENVKQCEEYCQPCPEIFTYPHLDYMNFQPMPCTFNTNTVMVNMEVKLGEASIDVPPNNVQLVDVQQIDVQQTDVQQTDVQQTDVQQPDVQQPDVQQPDVQQTDVQQTDVQRRDVRQDDVQQGDVQQTGVQQTGVQPAGVQQTGVQQAGVKQAGVQQTGVQQTGVQRTYVPQSDAPPLLQVPVGEIDFMSPPPLELSPIPLIHGQPYYKSNYDNSTYSIQCNGTVYYFSPDPSAPLVVHSVAPPQPLSDAVLGLPVSPPHPYPTPPPHGDHIVYGPPARFPAPPPAPAHAYPPPPAQPYAPPFPPPYAPPCEQPYAQALGLPRHCMELDIEQGLDRLTLQYEPKNNRVQQKPQKPPVGPRFKRIYNDIGEGQNGSRNGRNNGHNFNNKGHGPTNGGQGSRNGGQGSHNGDGYRSYNAGQNNQHFRNNGGRNNRRQPPPAAPPAPPASPGTPTARPAPALTPVSPVGVPSHDRSPTPGPPAYTAYPHPPPMYQRPALHDPAIINLSPVTYLHYGESAEFLPPYYAPPLSRPHHHQHQYHQQQHHQHQQQQQQHQQHHQQQQRR